MASVPAVSPWLADRRPAPSICVVSQGREAHGARAVRHPLAGAGPGRPCETRGFWVWRRFRRYRRGSLTGAPLRRFAWSHRAAPARRRPRDDGKPLRARDFDEVRVEGGPAAHIRHAIVGEGVDAAAAAVE